MIFKSKKVLVAISGGVDSAVAAALLQKAGYEVTGAFMKCYSGSIPGGKAPCWIEDRREALRVAAKLGIKLLTFDFEKEYHRDVIDYLYKEYRAGRTPNPDVMCNKYVKIPLLLKAAEKLSFDYIATGHYARLSVNCHCEERSDEAISYKLLQATDKNKDQTYFLHQLGQKELRRLIFPIGELCKNEVRALAKQFDLPVAEREESMGICFVGEVPMKEFLQKKIKPCRGSVILSNGGKVGGHDGLAFYTIGEKFSCHSKRQRRISDYCTMDSSALPQNDNKRALYVVDKDIKRNRLIVGLADNPLLFKEKIQVSMVNWLAGQAPKFPLSCEVRLRHRQLLQKAIVRNLKSKILVEFEAPQRAVTPGQFAVFYKDCECLGGGTIRDCHATTDIGARNDKND
ncbi:MAG: tRNA 2-thiouridine(34) synthase MnmA [Candidatus Magasanikbacteria bacterium]|nr:tRNA 2-thiouridine(34) synthase MnmA [Candidatus Magasanikbacteria bacterium]